MIHSPNFYLVLLASLFANVSLALYVWTLRDERSELREQNDSLKKELDRHG